MSELKAWEAIIKLEQRVNLLEKKVNALELERKFDGLKSSNPSVAFGLLPRIEELNKEIKDLESEHDPIIPPYFDVEKYVYLEKGKLVTALKNIYMNRRSEQTIVSIVKEALEEVGEEL